MDRTGSAAPTSPLALVPAATDDVRDSHDDLAVRALDAVECVVVVVEAGTGTVVEMNRAAESLTGYAADEVLGRPIWATLVAPSERDRAQACFVTGAGGGVPSTCELVIMTRAGALRRVVWSSTSLAASGGSRGHVVMTGVDVSVDDPAGGLFGRLIAGAGETATGAVCLDLQGRVTYVSRGACEILGYGSTELVDSHFPRAVLGRHLGATADGVGGSGSGSGEVWVGTDTTSVATGSDDERWSLVRKDGSRVTVVTSVSPVLNARGDHVGFLVMVRDLVAERRATDLLVSALEREADAEERVREAERVKDALVATVSHELRTPLTSITGYVEMLTEGMAGELTPVQSSHLEVVHRNTQRLTRLVEDLLSLSNVESGSFRPDCVELDLREALCAAVGQLDAVTEVHDLVMTYEVPPEPVTVLGDARHLERAVLNLLTNAVKFTADGGTVTCTITHDAEHVVLSVADTGIGIPQEEQGSLFRRFFRSSTAVEREIQGSGLGLAVVAAIVQNHGGEVAVRSEHLGGSEFTITLPLAVAPRAAAAPGAVPEGLHRAG